VVADDTLVVRDRDLSLQALTATGDFELASFPPVTQGSVNEGERPTARIVHEITTNGRCRIPANSGTAQFILTVGKVVEWTGDRGFCARAVPRPEDGPPARLSDTTWTGKGSVPRGYGIMEVSGLNAEADRRRGIHPAGAHGHGTRWRHSGRSGMQQSGTGTLRHDWRSRITALLGSRRKGLRRFLRTRSQAIGAAEGQFGR